MNTALNGLASLAFRIRRSRLGIAGPLLALGAAVLLILQLRPEDFVDTTVYPLVHAGDEVGKLQKYVRVRGTLLRDQAVQTTAEIGGQTLTGGSYVPLLIDGEREPVFVRDAGLPIGSGPVELVGLVLNKGSFPPVFISVESPPNVPLMNSFARFGILLGLATLVWLLWVWLLGRLDFALPVAAASTATTRGAGLLWFGGLGSAHGNAQVREAPLRMIAANHETRFETADSRESWAVHVRELRSATQTIVATSYGAQPALRLRFADERGQQRSGTLVAGDVAECARVLANLRRFEAHATRAGMVNDGA
jgi:hypothetical protein